MGCQDLLEKNRKTHGTGCHTKRKLRQIRDPARKKHQQVSGERINKCFSEWLSEGQAEHCDACVQWTDGIRILEEGEEEGEESINKILVKGFVKELEELESFGYPL